MMGFLEAVFRGLARLGIALHPRAIVATIRKAPLYAPLAVRSVRRRLIRHLLVGLSLGAGIVVFLGLAASFGGAASGAADRTRDMVLPAEVVVLGLGPVAGRAVDDLRWVAQAEDFETFDRWQAVSSAGQLWVVGLTPGGRLWRGLGLDRPADAEEVFLPTSLATGRLAVGGVIRLGILGPGGFVGREYRIAAVFETASADALLGETVVMNLDALIDLRRSLAPETGPAPAEESVLSGPNSVAVWQRDVGDLDRLRSRVATLFPQATIWWAGFPASQALRYVGGFLSPGNLVLAFTFVLAGLGVFNVMLLSLLQRKVQLGVLKALGAEDDEVFLLLLLEGAFMAIGGTFLGLGGGFGLVGYLDRASQIPLEITAGNLIWAIALAAVSFIAAAWLPATLCRRASPIQLMSGRRLYVNPRSTCAQCGRCGGF
jgi:hypothetical protein